MEYAYDWLHLLLRWFHVITGIAWIGSSFYFMWLDYSLEPPKEKDDRVKGENWSVHGGGFYHVKKFQKSPPNMPENLHWFKWEAYTTWITGFFLLVLLYYVQADLYLIDRSRMDLSIWQASLIGLGVLVGSWVAYDLLCRSPIGRSGLATALIGFTGLLGLTYGLGLVFSDRGAFMHAGVVMGTIMAANVFMAIIPNQKKMNAALFADKEPDPALGASSKLRSTHNNYITLPVLIVMIGNHFPMLYSRGNAWWVLGALIVIGGMLRHFFNLKNQGKIVWWLLPACALGFVLLAVAVKPRPSSDSGQQVVYEQVEPIFNKHCIACHAENPTFAGILEPPKGVVLTNLNEIKKWAGSIKVQVIDTRAMPLGNLTGMTDEERALVADWITGGSK